MRGKDLDRFEDLLARAAEAYPVREDNGFFLSPEEAVKALRDSETGPAISTIRKGGHAWALANPGPRTYGKEIRPPSTRTTGIVEVRA